jgi:TorA maturation chaperone TorD
VTDRSQQYIAEERSKAYWLLSRFYLTRPDPELVAEVRSWLAEADLGPNTAMDAAAILLGASLQGDGDGAVAERLARDYTRLLRGLKPGYGPPPPFESVYRGSDSIGAITTEVVRKMQRAGVGVVAPEIGPQDHIGAELRFMSLLCYRESRAASEGDLEQVESLRAQQETFLDHHLLRWVPDWCRMLEQTAHEPFYRGLARMTRDALYGDRRMLDSFDRELGPADAR